MLRRLVSSFFFGAALLSAPLAMAEFPSASCGDKPLVPNQDVPEGAQTASYTVSGMRCNGCAVKLHNSLLGLEGVYAADVDFENAKMSIRFDGKKLDSEAIVKAVKGFGFDAILES